MHEVQGMHKNSYRAHHLVHGLSGGGVEEAAVTGGS